MLTITICRCARFCVTEASKAEWRREGRSKKCLFQRCEAGQGGDVKVPEVVSWLMRHTSRLDDRTREVIQCRYSRPSFPTTLSPISGLALLSMDPFDGFQVSYLLHEMPVFPESVAQVGVIGFLNGQTLRRNPI
jgi:hypothetical protein